MSKRCSPFVPDFYKLSKRARSQDLYNHRDVEAIVNVNLSALQEQKPVHNRMQSSIGVATQRNILPFHNHFTTYGLFLEEKDKRRAISTARKVLAGPLPPPPLPSRRRHSKERTKAQTRVKSLRKTCTQVAVTYIKSKSVTSEEISKLPTHLKQRLFHSVAKRHHLDDELLNQFKDSDYERIYLKCATITNEGLSQFFNHPNHYTYNDEQSWQQYTKTNDRNGRTFSRLKSIDISFCRNLKGRQTSATIVDSSPALTHLNIAGCFDLTEGPAALGNIAKGLRNLVQLNISSVSWLIDSMLLLFIDWETQLKDLKVLIIDNCTRVDGVYIQEKLREIRADLIVKT